MKVDLPAAFPLIAYAAGLACGHSRAEAIGFAAIAILLISLRRVRVAFVCLALAGGIVAAVQSRASRAASDRALDALPARRFLVADAPIDGDWSRRGDAFALRCARFTANGRGVDLPLTIYARFSPPPIAMQRDVRVEGFVRRNDRGEAVMTVKSPRLLFYTGRRSPLHPATWNRALMLRLRPFAAAYPTEVALVEALALGRSERLEDDVRASYKRGGTYHLLVFSGMQIAFAAAGLALLLRWFRAPRTSDAVLLAFALIAPPFIGPSASVSRASIGIAVYALSRMLHRPTTLDNLWCVAALARLIVAPGDLTDAAFHLTYAGAGALMFIARAATSRRWLVALLATEMAITPLTLFHFHQYALGGSVMTLLLTPVVSAMLAVSVACCAWPCGTLLTVMALLHRACTTLNDAVSPLWGFFAAPPAVTMILAYGGALLAIAVLRGRARAAAMLGCLAVPLLAAAWVGTRDVGGPRLTALDVGQGDAILMRAPKHAVLVDAGPETAQIVPILADRGVRRLDAVVLTHVHPDHCGGLPNVIRHLRVASVWVSPRRFRDVCAQAVLEACAEREVPIHLVRDGEVATFGGIEIRALLVGHTFKRAPENNSSVVLRARIGRWTALLSGDIEAEAEDVLARREIAAEILKVAHHGSRSSTTAPFVDRVRPRLALISCGRRNLFGHPHEEVLEALRERHIRTWRTDRNGSIDVDAGGAHLIVRPGVDTPR